MPEPCGCKITPVGREVCAWHLVLRDKAGNVIDLRKREEQPHLGAVKGKKK